MSRGRWQVHARPPGTRGMVEIPALGSRSAWRWAIATAVAVVAMTVRTLVAHPEHRTSALVVLPLFGVLLLWVSWASMWLDTRTGALVVIRGRRLTYRVPLGPDTAVTLVPDHLGGRVLLALRPLGSRRRDFVNVLAVNAYVERSAPADLLRVLADTLEHHGSRGVEEVGPALLAQAAHLDAGGGPGTSPLAALLDDVDVRDTPPALVAR